MNKKEQLIKTKRMLIKPMSDHEIEEMIESFDLKRKKKGFPEISEIDIFKGSNGILDVAWKG